jgi:hypothetical protein
MPGMLMANCAISIAGVVLLSLFALSLLHFYANLSVFATGLAVGAIVVFQYVVCLQRLVLLMHYATHVCPFRIASSDNASSVKMDKNGRICVESREEYDCVTATITEVEAKRDGIELFSPGAPDTTTAKLLNNLVRVALPLFFGFPPGIYQLHHIVMHHKEDNVAPYDLSETQTYDRTSFFGLLKYVGFFITSVFVLIPWYACVRVSRMDLFSSAVFGWLTQLFCSIIFSKIVGIISSVFVTVVVCL